MILSFIRRVSPKNYQIYAQIDKSGGSGEGGGIF
jgi:hypothetical protein